MLHLKQEHANWCNYRKWLNFTHFGTEGETIATFRSASSQAWGEYWTKVLEYKYKYLKKWRVQVQVQVLDF